MGVVQEVEDGTVVRVSCGNEENCCGEVGSVRLVPTTNTNTFNICKTARFGTTWR